jgi:inosine-uridine nucleoside N-ribohydrolase
VDAAKALQTPAAAYVAKYPMLSYPLWDEVATGIWLDPTLVTRSEELSMDFDLDKGANYGATLSWMKGNGPGLGEPLVTVVWDIDVKRLDALFVDLIARPPAPAK